MLEKFGRRAALAACLIVGSLLAGCVTPPQKPVALNAGFAADKPKVGVAMTALPKPEMHLPGAGCLLCILAAQAANSDLSKHAETLTPEDLPALKEQAAAALRKRGLDVVVIADAVDLRALPDASAQGPNLARKNFAAFKTKWGVDQLVVLDVAQLGFERTYSAYIPTGEPRAVLRGAGYMVNLKTNAYEWYQPVEVRKGADGKWDEPKNFPGLTNAYFQAVELGKDSYLKPLAN